MKKDTAYYRWQQIKKEEESRRKKKLKENKIKLFLKKILINLNLKLKKLIIKYINYEHTN